MDDELQIKLLDAITRAQGLFISSDGEKAAFEALLADLLSLTGSAYGIIGEVLFDDGVTPYLRIAAISDIAWNDSSREFLARHGEDGLEFFNLGTLIGAVLTSGTPVLANEPQQDPRRGWLPDGHPSIDSFLGIPIIQGGKLVAMAGVANREGGYPMELVEQLKPFTATIGRLVLARRHEKQYRKRAACLQKIIDLLPMGVFMVDAAGRKPKLFNDEAVLLLGRGLNSSPTMASLASGYQLYRAGGDELYPEEELPVIKALAGERVSVDDIEVLRPDGSRKLLRIQGVPVRGADGRVEAGLAFLQEA